MSGNPTTPPARVPDGGMWMQLRGNTAARIGLARSGASLATKPLLDFQLAHARARDAVHAPLDTARLTTDLAALGLPVLALESAAADRQSYLMRPDLGRRLGPGGEAQLRPRQGSYDVVFVVSDGLSALAVQNHATPVLAGVLANRGAAHWQIAPLIAVRHGRVAIGDAIAASLGADCAIVLIGERPGLSAPDSMGAYLTWKPHAGSVDADRNCISNIRPEGIGYAEAAAKLSHLLAAMRARRLSGVRLKDDSDRLLNG
jgi:ethanolamine ammonia-lyase small subunit